MLRCFEVFNKIDAIVVPSIWLENSPLVIHEALQAGVLVITADVGGMAEYVHHEAIEGQLLCDLNISLKLLSTLVRRHRHISTCIISRCFFVCIHDELFAMTCAR